MRDREEDQKVRGIFTEYLAESLSLPLAIDSICICRQRVVDGLAEDFYPIERAFFSA